MNTEIDTILAWLRERSAEAQQEIDHLQKTGGAQLPIEETKRKIQYWSGIRRMSNATITWIEENIDND